MNDVVKSHDDREKIVFNFFNQAVDDADVILMKNKQGGDVIPLRIQAVVSFTLVDIFANYWFEYENKTGTEKERFLNWYEAYCGEKNKFRSRRKIWKEILPEQVYRLRSSLVHFLGLSQNSEIVLISNNTTRSEMRRFSRIMNKQIKKTVRVMKTNDLHLLVKAGALVMLEEWRDNIKNSPEKHIAGIERIYQKINQEGAFLIRKDQKPYPSN